MDKITVTQETRLYIYFIISVILIFTLEFILFRLLKAKQNKLNYLTPFSLFLLSIISVGFYFFWSGHSPLNVENQISFIEVIITFISVLIIMWGGYIAIQQLKISAQANQVSSQNNKLASFQFMVSRLQDAKARETRKIVFSLYNEKNHQVLPIALWNTEQENAVRTSLANLDEIGLLVKYNLLDYSFLEGWYYSIYKILYIGNEFRKANETSYSYSIENSQVKASDYYLGIAELTNRKDNNKKYDFEKNYPEFWVNEN